MAEPELIEPEGAYVGEFRRGPAFFTVHRIAVKPSRYRIMCSDGNGPSPVCVFTEAPGSQTRWHGAWNGDQWCDWIETEIRKTIAPLPTRVRRQADRCPRTRPPQRRRTRPMPSRVGPQDRARAGPVGQGGDRPARLRSLGFIGGPGPPRSAGERADEAGRGAARPRRPPECPRSLCLTIIRS